jgi:AAHS family 4-hydroxybenzoate transporter-like MFS transporter
MTQNNTVDIAEVVETQERSWFTVTLFVLCALVMLADGFDNQALNYAAPGIIKEWGINRALMTPVFNISIVGWMAGSVVFAMLADRIGRRRAILLATALFGCFTFAVPFAHNLVELSILRFCAALGIGGGMPMAVSLITDYARSGKRGLIITLLYLGYTAGSSGGGLLAAEIIPAYGWRSVFYVGGAGAVVAVIILFAALPESIRYLILRNPTSERILAFARKLKPSAQFADDTRFTIQEQAHTGVPVRHLFTEGRSAMTIFLWLALGLSFVTHFFLSQWMTTLLTDEIGFANAARSQALFQLGAGFSWFFGWMIDKKGVRVMTLTMILGAIPVAVLGSAGPGWEYRPQCHFEHDLSDLHPLYRDRRLLRGGAHWRHRRPAARRCPDLHRNADRNDLSSRRVAVARGRRCLLHAQQNHHAGSRARNVLALGAVATLTGFF